MGRYLRLYAHMVRFSFSRAMEFRVDFFFRVFMDTLWYAVHLTFFAVIFRETKALGGWNWDQTLVFAASMFLMDAIQMTLFSNNTWWFPTIVNRGDLDYYLVRPVSSLFFVSLRDFAANSFLNLLLAIGIFVWALVRYPDPLGAGRVGLFVLLLLAGVYLFYLLSMILLVARAVRPPAARDLPRLGASRARVAAPARAPLLLSAGGPLRGERGPRGAAHRGGDRRCHALHRLDVAARPPLLLLGVELTARGSGESGFPRGPARLAGSGPARAPVS